MYIPGAFRVDDTVWIQQFLRSNSFATLVTVREGTPFANHLPFRYVPQENGLGVLQAHLARANPQWKSWTEAGSQVPEEEALIVFAGAHAYISPTWYRQQPSVPTWNYEVVHVYGRPRLMTETELRTFLADLTAEYEGDSPDAWKLSALSDDYLQKMLGGIVGVEIAITRWESKSKMSQNRSEADRQGVITGLRAQGDALSVATADQMAKSK